MRVQYTTQSAFPLPLKRRGLRRTLSVNPEIAGVEYQQGTLAGYELREYLLEKWGRCCAYCKATGVPLQVEHIVPRSRGGSNRASNLTLACGICNQKKGAMTAEEFGHPDVQAQARRSLRDAAAVNATHWALYRRLRATGLPVETGTGGRTKWNRTRRNLPKAYWLDAACVGASTPERLTVAGVQPLGITPAGHGNRQLCGTDKHGFPARHRTRHKRFFGFQTGDLVRAEVPAGFKTAGRHVGRVLVRASGSFDVATVAGRVAGIRLSLRAGAGAWRRVRLRLWGRRGLRTTSEHWGRSPAHLDSTSSRGHCRARSRALFGNAGTYRGHQACAVRRAALGKPRNFAQCAFADSMDARSCVRCAHLVTYNTASRHGWQASRRRGTVVR